jgi:hypothetical protein
MENEQRAQDLRVRIAGSSYGLHRNTLQHPSLADGASVGAARRRPIECHLSRRATTGPQPEACSGQAAVTRLQLPGRRWMMQTSRGLSSSWSCACGGYVARPRRRDLRVFGAPTSGWHGRRRDWRVFGAPTSGWHGGGRRYSSDRIAQRVHPCPGTFTPASTRLRTARPQSSGLSGRNALVLSGKTKNSCLPWLAA